VRFEEKEKDGEEEEGEVKPGRRDRKKDGLEG
jgi:hypothetical protein